MSDQVTSGQVELNLLLPLTPMQKEEQQRVDQQGEVQFHFIWELQVVFDSDLSRLLRSEFGISSLSLFPGADEANCARWRRFVWPARITSFRMASLVEVDLTWHDEDVLI